jgi:hypothetical protein
MSAYEVNKVCYRALHDLPFREALKADPQAALAPLPLTEAERKALLAGQVGRLYEMGVSGFLLSYLPRWEIFGLTVPVYSERMRAAADPR